MSYNWAYHLTLRPACIFGFWILLPVESIVIYPMSQDMPDDVAAHNMGLARDMEVMRAVGDVPAWELGGCDDL